MLARVVGFKRLRTYLRRYCKEIKQTMNDGTHPRNERDDGENGEKR